MADTRTILSIDGGGIRGVIPAMVLREIEDQTGRRIAELFDVIAGTSTGGLIALGLACPDDGPAPRFRAQELVELYEREGKTIFPHHLFGRLRQLGDEKYSADGLEKVLEDTFGDTRLKDALTGVIVPAYDIELREPVFFRSQRAKEDPDTYDFRMRDVARARPRHRPTSSRCDYEPEGRGRITRWSTGASSPTIRGCALSSTPTPGRRDSRTLSWSRSARGS